MIQGRALPSDSVYQGTDASLFCCINMDPRSFIDDDGVCICVFFAVKSEDVAKSCYSSLL